MMLSTPLAFWIGFFALAPLSSRAAPCPALSLHASSPSAVASASLSIASDDFRRGWNNKNKRQENDLVLTETRTVTTLETSTDIVTDFITVSVDAAVGPSASSVAPVSAIAKDDNSDDDDYASLASVSVSPAFHFVGDAPAVADAESILFLPDVSVQVGVSVLSTTSSASSSLSANSSITAPAPQSTGASDDGIATATATASSGPLPNDDDTPAASTSSTASDSDDTLDSTSSTATTSDGSLATDSPSPPDSDSDPSNANSNSTDASPVIAATPPPLKGPILAAYYPDWVSDTLPPESIDFSHLDWIDFAFGVPDAKFNIGWDDSSSTALLSRLVKAAHAKKTKVKLSLGGWGGSKYFSSAVATTSSRQTFAKNIVAVYKQYSLDGIDIDWEYPGQQGAGSNQVSPQDSANFLAFLKVLRTALPSTARITAAVQDVPFADASGNPMKDVSAFASVLDWVNLMNYDVWGASKNPGPNAPLSDACGNSTQPQMNAVAGVKAWTNAKFPASKLILGVPAYGYLNPSSKTTLKQRSEFDDDPSVESSDPSTDPDSNAAPDASDANSSNSSLTFQQDSRKPPPPKTIITLKDANGNPSGAQIQFNSILAQGALVPEKANSSSSSSPPPPYSTFVGYGGFTRFWDSCSSTPFLVSPYSNQVVTYDDPQSLNLKAAFARQAGILGVAVWDLSGDTKQSDLISALSQGLGK